MKLCFLYISILILASPVVRADSNTPVRVKALDGNVDLKVLTGPYADHPDTLTIEQSNQQQAFPASTERDVIFEKVKISGYLADFDALAKDELFMRAKHQNGQELHENFYKQIAVDRLELLHVEAVKWMNKGEEK